MAVAIPFIMAFAAVASTATTLISAATAPSAPVATDDSKKQSQQALEASYAQAQLLRKRQGTASTILTGPQGVTNQPQTMKTTLGG